jgi:thiol-disulfide isomerase/thioredoxin|tara:strand:- start:2800 stop:4185 length:1386 start_codon:yes stop_codon:yes gene_type:complete
MNKYLFLLATTLFISCNNEHSNIKEFATISGKVLNSKETLLRITTYDYRTSKKVLIDSSGYYRDTIHIQKKGFYGFQIGSTYTSVYLKKGDNLEVNLDANEFFKSISASGMGSEINNFKFNRSRLMSELVGDAKEFFVVPLEQFLDKLNSNKIAYSEQLEESSLSLEDKDMFRKINEFNYILTKFNYDKFNHYHLKKHPILPEGYNDLVLNIDIDDDKSFHFDKSYRILIIEYFRLTSKNALTENPNLSLVDFVENKIKHIKSTKIKDQIISMLFRTQIKLDNKNIDSDYERIHNLISSKNLKEKLTERYEAIGISKPETTAASFNYENHKGGTTSLNDLKGKILYIDIWATWCGPCINEMPALTELIKDFKGKNIEFVNISIDTKNQYDKWRAMVPELNVGGLQLIADNGLKSEFMKAYSVGLIPRSMLIDENGKIINAMAPKPSDPKTKNYLNELLLNR